MSIIKKISPRLSFVFLYGMIGAVWILFSDSLLFSFIQDSQELTTYQSYKGWIFVLITTAFLYFLLLWYDKLVDSTKKEKEQTEKKFQLLYQDAPNPYQSLDVNGKILAVNQQWLDMLGYKKQEVIGVWFGDILTPKSIIDFQNNFVKFKKNGSIMGAQFEMIHKNGTVVPILLHGQIAYDNSHTMLQTHCAFEDISHKQKVEHLNKVLKLIRDVNQTIVRVKDHKTLLQESCNILMSSNLYNYAWIEMIQENPSTLYYTSKHKEQFSLFAEKLKQGYKPECMQRLNQQNKSSIFIQDTNNTCQECPLKAIHSIADNAYSLQIKHNNSHYGYLTVSSFSQFDTDELALLEEVAGDIAYGLFNIETEQILKENEERYRFAIEGATDGLWDWDIVSNVVYYSPRYKEMLGFNHNEFQNSIEDWKKHLHPDDKEQVLSVIKNIQKKEIKHYHNIHRLRHKDGHWVWIEARGQTLFDENAKAIRMIGSNTDITEKKLLEVELQKSYETLNKLADNIPGTIYQYKVDSEGKASFPYASRGIEDVYEVTPEEIVESAEPIFNILHQEDYRKILSTITESAERLQEWNLEYRVQLPHKGLRWLQGKAKPEKLEDGSVLWHGFIIDITQTHRLHTLLQDTQSISHIGSWEQNSQDERLFWSDETYRIFEIDPKTNIPMAKFLDTVHPDDRSLLINTIQKSIDEHTAYSYQHRLLFPDGRIKYVIERGEHFYDKKNAYIKTAGSVQDITEQFLIEDSIKQRDTMFTAIFQVIPDLLFIMNEDGLIVDYRANRESVLYLKPEFFLGKFIQDVLPSDVGELFRKNLVTLAENYALNIFRYQLEIEGEIRHYEARMAKLPLENRIMTIVRDISEELSYEQQLLFQSQLLEQSLAATNVIDENLQFSYVNDAYVKMFGYENKEEILGTSPREHCFDPEFPKKIINQIKKKGSHSFLFKAKRKDGTPFDVLMSAQSFYHIGKQYFLNSSMDVTENQKNMQELNEKKEELESIIKNAPNPMVLHKEGGEILMLNQAWIDSSGYSLEEIPTIYDWIDITYDDEQERNSVKKHVDSLYKISGKVEEGAFTFFNKKREPITWQFSSAPLGVLDSKRIIISSAMDITELKHKDAMLINQSRHAAMGEMISMIAHQWRQPLSTISMDANNMLLDIALDDFTPEGSEKYAKSISEQTQHLSQTIDDFRNFFKPDKAVSQVNIKEILNQTFSIVKDSLKNNNILLKCSFETKREVEAYPRELMQVFVNIITNAKDVLVATKTEEALIVIRVYEDEKYVTIEICDNGGGIDEEILPKIFDPYFSTKDEKTGTGLGLYMSQMIIKEHLNGLLDAYNKDKGACFMVSLLKNRVKER